MLAKRLRLGKFTNTCEYWLEHCDPDSSEYIRFLDYLDITDSDFWDIATDKRPVLEFVGQLKRRIERMEQTCEWLELIDLWSHFSLGDDLATYCAQAIEEAIMNGNAFKAAKIAMNNPLNRHLSTYAFQELAQEQDDGTIPLQNTGIISGHVRLI